MSIDVVFVVLTAAFLGGRLLDRFNIIIVFPVIVAMVMLIGVAGISRHVPIVELVLLCAATVTTFETGYFLGLTLDKSPQCLPGRVPSP